MYKRISYLSLFFIFFMFHSIYSRDVFDVLMEYSETERFSNITPLYWAVEKKDEEAVKLLIAHGTDMQSACREDQKSLTYPLYAYTPLSLAVEQDSKNIISIICHNSANPNDLIIPMTPLCTTEKSAIYKFFARLSKRDPAKLIERWNKCPNFPENAYYLYGGGTIPNALFEAICLGKKEIIKIFAEAGVNLNTPCLIGHNCYTLYTPLKVAMIMEEKEIIKILLAHGAIAK